MRSCSWPNYLHQMLWCVSSLPHGPRLSAVIGQMLIVNICSNLCGRWRTIFQAIAWRPCERYCATFVHIMRPYAQHEFCVKGGVALTRWSRTLMTITMTTTYLNWNKNKPARFEKIAPSMLFVVLLSWFSNQRFEPVTFKWWDCLKLAAGQLHSSALLVHVKNGWSLWSSTDHETAAPITHQSLSCSIPY